MTIEPHETAFRYGGKGLGSATLDLDELERKAKAATPGPWTWWDSCSFRRLSSDATGNDGDVLRAVTHRDGVSDIYGSEADKALIAAMSPSVVLALIERVRAAEGALKSCNVANANLVERVLELERLWAEESSARIRKLDLSRKDT